MKRQSAWFQPSILVASATLLIFSSCKKDQSSNQPPTQESATAVQITKGDQVSNQLFNNVFSISLGVQSSDAGGNMGIGSGQGILYRPGGAGEVDGDQCFTVNVTPRDFSTWPKTVTWDFGTTGCLGKDGKVRKGKIISVFTKPAFMSGAVITTTLQGYQVDSFAISGTQTVQNNSTGAQGISFDVKVTNGKITNLNSQFWHQVNSEYNFSQATGASTPLDFSDDSYSLTGGISGTNSANINWTSTITSPLIIKYGCLWFGKGVVSITWDSNPTPATLDYGNGTCDNKATLSYKGWSTVINL